jgi:short-subunit dehydrogenase
MNTKQTVLITGATSGIGRYTALHLARKGYRVIATGRNTDALAGLQKEANGTSLETLRLDVSDATSIETAKRAVDELTGGYGLDVLVNNAGYGTAGPTEECTDEDLRRQYDVNVFGLMAVTRAFLPQMRERGRGRVVNVSSVGGRLTLPLFGAYNSTKYAVESLTDALRMELRPFGVYFSLIEPGVIDTGFADRTMVEVKKYQDDDASPYAAVTARAQELRAMTDKQAVGPACIARAIERAISSRRPRARYVAPFRARIMLWFADWMPTWAVDGLMRKLVGLNRKRLGLDGARSPRLEAVSR